MPAVCRVPYRRSRFSTRLPDDRRYTPAHYWLLPVGENRWRVGLTQFATRMLGDLVEHGFEVKPGEAVELGQTVGWVEAFKATTDLFCAGSGTFVSRNEALDADPALFDADPYGAGYLYEFEGSVDPRAVDVAGYVDLLNLAIDKIQGKLEAGE